MPTSFAIIILNFRTAEMTLSCVESLLPQLDDVAPAKIVIVDNASGDGSVETLSTAIRENGWTDRVELVESPVNGGFSAGNNVGLRHIQADAYLLLNSDTKVEAGALATLMAAFHDEPRAGLIGPRILKEDGSLHPSCYRFHSIRSELIRGADTGPVTKLFNRHVTTLTHLEEPMEAEWVSFACVLLRHDTLNQVGLMDEGYFLYFEDQDYARRVKDAGWSVICVPTAKVTHFAGKSGPVRELQAAKQRLPRYYYASRARYFAKFKGRVGLWGANLFWSLGWTISAVRGVLGLRRKNPHCERATHDIWTNASAPMTPTTLPPRDRSGPSA